MLFDVILTGRLFLALVAAHAVAAVAFVVLLPVARPLVALLALLVLARHCAIHLRLLVRHGRRRPDADDRVDRARRSSPSRQTERRM